MKVQSRSLLGLAQLAAFSLACSLSQLSAQTMPPSGSFGFLISSTYANPTPNNGWAALGLMNFDGAGNISGTYNAQFAGGPPPVMSATGSLTGSYSSNPDGTGTVTVALDAGISLTFAMVMADQGNGLQLVATGCSGSRCDLSGTLISGFARTAYTGGSPNGSYGGQFNITPNAAVSLDVLSFDGAGNVTFSGTFIGSGQSQGGGPVNQSQIFVGTQSGTYTINPDGSGLITLAPANPGGNGQTHAIVMADGGSTILVMQTNRSGDGVSFGAARLQ